MYKFAIFAEGEARKQINDFIDFYGDDDAVAAATAIRKLRGPLRFDDSGLDARLIDALVLLLVISTLPKIVGIIPG